MGKAIIALEIDTESGNSRLFGSENIEKAIRKEYKRINNSGIKGQAIAMLLAQHLTEALAKEKIYAKKDIDGIKNDGDKDEGLKFVLSWKGKRKLLKKVLKETLSIYEGIIEDFRDEMALAEDVPY